MCRVAGGSFAAALGALPRDFPYYLYYLLVISHNIYINKGSPKKEKIKSNKDATLNSLIFPWL